MSSSDDKHAKQLFASYKSWRKMTDAPFKSKGHGNMMVHDWVNSRALATFRAKKGSYVPGAALAKTGWKGDTLKKVWLMEKRGSGYDKENGDWWYAQLNAAGKVEKAGKLSGCIDCHAGADNDYVFGLKK